MRRAVTSFLAIGFLAACALYFVFFYDAPDKVDPNPLVIAGVAMAAVAAYCASFAAEYIPLRATTMTRSNGATIFAAAAIANLSSYLGVIVGMPARFALWRRVLGVPISDSMALLIYLTLIGTAIPGWIASVTLATEQPLLALACGGAGTFLVGMLAWPWLAPHGGLGAAVKAVAARLPQRLTRRIGRVAATTFGFQPRLGLQIAFVYTLWYLASALQTTWTLDLFHESAPFLLLLGAQSASFLLGRLSALPLGLGVRDASFVALMTSFGLPHEVAISVAAIDRAASLATRLVMAAVAMALVSAGAASLKAVSAEPVALTER